MSVSQYGQTFNGGSTLRIDATQTNDLLIYAYGGGGILYRLHNGIYSTVASNLDGSGVADGQAIAALTDGSALIYRQDGEFGPASFGIVNEDGSVRVQQTSAATNGDGQGHTESIRGPSATATADGGFFLAASDNTYGDQSVHLSFPQDSDGFTGTDLGRGFDISHRTYTAAGAATSAFVFDSIGPYSAAGASTDYSAGNQYISDTVTLANGTVIEASIEPRYYANTGYRYYSQTAITLRTVSSSGSVNGPIQANDEGPTTNEFNPERYRVDGAGGVQLVAMPDGGFATIWEEQSRIADSSVYGGYRFNGYDARIRYFDQNGNALTSELQLLHRGPEFGNNPLSIGADALSDGRIALAYVDGVYGVNGTAASRLFVETVTRAGSGVTLSTTAITPDLGRGHVVVDFDLKSIGGSDIAISFSDDTGGQVKTYHVGADSGQILFGTTDADTLSGTSGADTIYSNGGADTLSGGGGNDTFFVSFAPLLVDGGAGTDTLVIQNGSLVTLADGELKSIEAIRVQRGATLDLSAFSTAPANVTTEAGSGAQATIIGSQGNDRITALGDDVLKGGAGNDLYYVDIAADQVIEASGGGADTVYASADYTLGAGQEIETLRANAGATGLTLTGNELANALFGGSGADHLVGAGGNDTLNGGAGTDTLEGGIGNDSYYVDSAADQVIEAAGAGSDTVYASASFTLAAGQEIETLRANAGATGLTLTGNEIANALFGYVGADRLVGGGGNDTLNGGGGADTMEGGTGNDIYYVDTLGDQVLEAVGAGTDTVYAATNITLAAGQEIEIVRANAGATGLTITGNEFSNTLFGGTGNDALNGGAGLDSLRGGVGDDAYYVDAAGDTVIEAAGAGTDTVYASANYTLATGQEIEFLRGNAGATGLTLTGNEIANTIIGNAGADRLVGGGGNDTLNGGAGADRLEGGIGNDVYLVDSAADTVIEATGAGTDTVYASASFTLGAGQEIETLRGNAGATGLTLTGNGLANAIFGNTGADVLSGGGGADVLTGGAGADSFVFKAVSESVVGAGRVTIADFAAGQDHIDLSAIQAVTGASTDQAFSYIGAGVAFTNVAGQLHTVTSGSNTIVEGDVDGNGTADFQIAVRGLLTLQAGDFVL